MLSVAPETLLVPLWELSSFSEAAKAAALLVEVLSDPPLSQASQLPHLSCVDDLSCVDG